MPRLSLVDKPADTAEQRLKARLATEEHLEGPAAEAKLTRPSRSGLPSARVKPASTKRSASVVSSRVLRWGDDKDKEITGRSDGSNRSTRESLTSLRSKGLTKATFSRTSCAALAATARRSSSTPVTPSIKLPISTPRAKTSSVGVERSPESRAGLE